VRGARGQRGICLTIHRHLYWIQDVPDPRFGSRETIQQGTVVESEASAHNGNGLVQRGWAVGGEYASVFMEGGHGAALRRIPLEKPRRIPAHGELAAGIQLGRAMNGQGVFAVRQIREELRVDQGGRYI